MNNHYKSALDKIKLKESEKDRAKALFYEANKEKETSMKVKKLFKPAVAVAACLALIIATYAIVPMFQEMPEAPGDKTTTSNFFSITAYAKELTKTGKVFSDKYSSLFSAICGDEKGGIAFSLDFPFKCKGQNIDTITYSIKNGVFVITNPKNKSVVIDGEKITQELNVPDSSAESERKEKLTYENQQYKSFTVAYDNQINDKTCINISDTSDIWNAEKKNQYRDFNYDIGNFSLQKTKKVLDFLTKDMGITCTVTYKDGSTETKNIVVSNEIVRPSHLLDEEIPEEKNKKTISTCYSIE